MKKNYIYFIIIFSFFAFVLLIVRYRKPEVTYELQMRQGMLASSSEWVNTKAAIDGLIYKVRTNPSDKRSILALGMAYIQESRISGNHSYYDNAALNLFEKILKDEPENFEALIGKATILLSQHHFTDALPVAELAKKVSPHSATVYGLLTDVYVETGNYDKAIEMADKMTATRPDIRSYSRISYLREIFGDYKGAIDAMKMAVAAGYPGMEQTDGADNSSDIYLKISVTLKMLNSVTIKLFIFAPLFLGHMPEKQELQKPKETIYRPLNF